MHQAPKQNTAVRIMIIGTRDGLKRVNVGISVHDWSRRGRRGRRRDGGEHEKKQKQEGEGKEEKTK